MSGANPGCPPAVAPENVQICGDSLPADPSYTGALRVSRLLPGRAHPGTPGKPAKPGRVQPRLLRGQAHARPRGACRSSPPAPCPPLPCLRPGPISLCKGPSDSTPSPCCRPGPGAPTASSLPGLAGTTLPLRPSARPAAWRTPNHRTRGLGALWGTSHGGPAPPRHTNARTLSADLAPGGPLARMGGRRANSPREVPLPCPTAPLSAWSVPPPSPRPLRSHRPARLSL